MNSSWSSVSLLVKIWYQNHARNFSLARYLAMNASTIWFQSNIMWRSLILARLMQLCRLPKVLIHNPFHCLTSTYIYIPNRYLNVLCRQAQLSAFLCTSPRIKISREGCYRYSLEYLFGCQEVGETSAMWSQPSACGTRVTLFLPQFVHSISGAPRYNAQLAPWSRGFEVANRGQKCIEKLLRSNTRFCCSMEERPPNSCQRAVISSNSRRLRAEIGRICKRWSSQTPIVSNCALNFELFKTSWITRKSNSTSLPLTMIVWILGERIVLPKPKKIKTQRKGVHLTSVVRCGAFSVHRSWYKEDQSHGLVS